MKTSEGGLEFIMAMEGCKTTAYPDPGTGGEPYTIGVGRAHGVKPGDTCTREQALQWLREDAVTAEKCIANSVKVPLTQAQYDSLVSWIFNLGCGNFGKSSLLRLLNQGADDELVAAEFLKWDRANGRVMAGLTKRREAERELFLT